ncbi:MAG TPA: diphosphate--fructose-6-phosphate 1-phosphotransferase, partial [Polyangiaceae bacterium]|nr:diphosphate--fructose-6-phosphate 1-phosphotransferase [Polyangiaceae bacterium]
EDVRNVYGMRFGIEGFMQDLLVDLGAQSRATLDRVRATPSSALGSSRHKLRDEELSRVLEQLARYDVRYLFLIGGNDTMETIHRVEETCREKGYALRGVGVPKTVDNDLNGTDHTPGYPSAAQYVARSIAQGGILARDMQRVDKFTIFQTVGREAGWLPASGALGKRHEADPPHLIYFPERPFDPERCLADVDDAIRRYDFCSIVVGEGLRYADGRPVSGSTTKDPFQNVEFGAMGGASVAMVIHRMLSDRLGVRGEFQVVQSLQMAASDRRSRLDAEEAYLCGREAVRLAAAGVTGVMVSLLRPEGPYRTTLGTVPLLEVAGTPKPMRADFINAAGNFVTPAYFEYARPLVDPMEDFGDLDFAKVAAPR